MPLSLSSTFRTLLILKNQNSVPYKQWLPVHFHPNTWQLPFCFLYYSESVKTLGTAWEWILVTFVVFVCGGFTCHYILEFIHVVACQQCISFQSSSTLWLLWIILVWTWVHKYLLVSLVLVLLDRTHSEVAEFYGNCLIFWGNAKLFSNMMHHGVLLLILYRVPISPYPLTVLVIFYFVDSSYANSWQMALFCFALF